MTHLPRQATHSQTSINSGAMYSQREWLFNDVHMTEVKLTIMFRQQIGV